MHHENKPPITLTPFRIKALQHIEVFHKELLPEAFKIYIKNPHAGAFMILLGCMNAVHQLNLRIFVDFSSEDLRQFEFVIETMEDYIKDQK